ncbi:hypothetical protein PHYSODRAFT_320949 [Phytophthora sojae]|uniref:Uncharacterized protein n=1 Tax=Phytophthora sojae (strain P6497) TaxID=1094619 RepID=G4YJX5_PHYSP|nr:hypothetical protein PHYSODRAFT_320949 [Phytophthora sojae]EGZ27107.1 hypothetical protein PHYSODRAFT_320949 [Phytophthora sojae]|eukprot:XP_009514382.1 hypothetical protein PHYSODRAFT_320949 [Phytophthora sojae]
MSSVNSNCRVSSLRPVPTGSLFINFSFQSAATKSPLTTKSARHQDAPASSADAPLIPARLPSSAPPVGGAGAGAGNGGGSLDASGEAHVPARAGSPARKVDEAEETMEVDDQAGTGEDDDADEEEEEEEESAASSARNSPLRPSGQPVQHPRQSCM